VPDSANGSTNSTGVSVRPGNMRRRGTGSSSFASGVNEEGRMQRTQNGDWGIADDARMGLE